jgi:CRP-like cAMP-binding protein
MARSVRNHLLSAMSPPDYGLLEPHFTRIEFSVRQAFEEANKPIEHVYFPENGIVSIVAKSRHDQAEAALIGREGMTGIPVVLGNDRWVNDAYVQVDGSGFRIAANDLRRALAKSANLRAILLAFTQAFVVQTTQTALANARGIVEMRLARWLLMAHDRLDGDELPLTHEFLALMLGVRRAGVTTTLQKLENDGLVDTKRGLVVVEDRAGLIGLADRLYGVPEAEYRRLIPGSKFATDKD